MSIKFYCNSETCTHADKGPFVIELPTGAVMDKNNMATVFCPRCAKPMKPLPSDTQTDAMHHRFLLLQQIVQPGRKMPFLH